MQEINKGELIDLICEAAERERQCNFKIGDTVKAVTNAYVYTNIRGKWVGVVTEIDEDGFFGAVTKHSVYAECKAGDFFGVLIPSDFELVNQAVP